MLFFTSWWITGVNNDQLTTFPGKLNAAVANEQMNVLVVYFIEAECSSKMAKVSVGNKERPVWSADLTLRAVQGRIQRGSQSRPRCSSKPPAGGSQSFPPGSQFPSESLPRQQLANPLFTSAQLANAQAHSWACWRNKGRRQLRMRRSDSSFVDITPKLIARVGLIK